MNNKLNPKTHYTPEMQQSARIAHSRTTDDFQSELSARLKELEESSLEPKIKKRQVRESK
jgi:hypothetical protein